MKQVNWHIEEKVILVRITSDLKLDDLDELNLKVENLLEVGNPPVHVIYHSDDVSTPLNISKVSKKLNFLHHENCGWIISVGSSSTMKFVGNIVTKLSKINLKTVDKLENANDVLGRVDPSIFDTV